MHTAIARNWNGQRIEVRFEGKGDMRSLARKARTTIERQGYSTYQLVEVDGEKVPYDLQF